MKTLDEVIEILQRQTDKTRIKILDKDLLDSVPDALFYLNEYQKTVNQLRKGTWIPVDSGTVNGRCSVCGYESRLYENDVYGEHYCPNCGAWLRMI